MSKANDLIRQMLDGAEPIQAVRKTTFVPQDDGTLIRRTVGRDGVVVSEERISKELRMSLDARVNMGLSQGQFANLLGISVRTLHDWEQGRREPSGAAKTLLKIVSKHPDILREMAEHHDQI